MGTIRRRLGADGRSDASRRALSSSIQLRVSSRLDFVPRPAEPFTLRWPPFTPRRKLSFLAVKYPHAFTQWVPELLGQRVPAVFTQRVPLVFTQRVPAVFTQKAPVSRGRVSTGRP